MKNSLNKFFVLAVLVTILSSIANAQISVTIRPTAPFYERPLRPSPRHMWVDGDWIWRGGRYEYANGYWVIPPRNSAVWVPGHWKRSFRGWMWKPGHWRRW